MREDTALGNSGDRALHSNRRTVRGTLLKIILDNWAVFQELWDDILEEKFDSIQKFEVNSYVLKRKSKALISFFFLIHQKQF